MSTKNLPRLALLAAVGALLAIPNAVLAQNTSKEEGTAQAQGSASQGKTTKSAEARKAARERRAQRRADRQLLAWSNAAARETLTPMLGAQKANAKKADPSVRLLEGRLLEQEGALDAALQAFQAAADLAPQHPEPHLRLASAHQRAEQSGPAQTHLRAALDHATAWCEREPENAEAFYSLGQAYQGLGRLPKAVGAYQQALELDPALALPAYYLGTAYYQQEKWDAALAALNQAITHNDHLAYAYFFRGLTQGKVKQTAAMLNDLDHFIAMAPTAPEAETARTILAALR